MPDVPTPRPDPHLPPPGVEYQSSWPIYDQGAQLWGYELVGVGHYWRSGPVYNERSMALRAAGKMLAWTIRRAATPATHAAQVA